MNTDTIYAVIDLETTGTSVNSGDRVIQIGIALIQSGQIIQTVSQLINPDRDVPRRIQQLTAITPKMLVTAPYFEEIGPVLSAMLKDTVIVAHNINFDYPFLSAEFERIGLPALDNPGIDTVELAQVLLPTTGSYRLVDLTSMLGIEHDNPHRADSDAVSTAKLLLNLTKRFQHLPSHTQAQLTAHPEIFLRETGQYLKVYEQKNRVLPDSLQQVGRFILRRPLNLVDTINHAAYPQTDDQKRQLLKPTYRFRKAQGKMMDAIYAHAESDTPLFIEAGTGMGKSLGYLLPYAYLASPQHKLVITTATLVLQDQLVNQTIPALAETLHQELPTVTLKGASHYLDLHQFDLTLAQTTQNRLTRLLQLKLLVWLTQTRTGDLDELRLTNDQSALFAQIRHTGHFGSPETNPYFAVDFYGQIQNQLKQAHIVVTNHAYFVRHQPEKMGYLVVDEAHQLPDVAVSALAQTVDLGGIKRAMEQIKKVISHPEQPQLMTTYANDQVISYQLRSIITSVEEGSAIIDNVMGKLYRHFFKQMRRQNALVQPLSQNALRELYAQVGEELERLAQLIPQLLTLANQLPTDFHRRLNYFVKSDYQLFQSLEAHLNQLTNLLEPLQAFIASHETLIQGSSQVSRLTMRHIDDIFSIKLHWQNFVIAPTLKTLLSPYQSVVLTSATLQVDRSFDFFASQLGYPAPDEDHQLKLRSPFHYKQQAQFFVASDSPQVGSDDYATQLANAINQLADDEAQTLVLFNSLSTLEAVYHRLNQLPIGAHREILAQGVTGSAEKIAKRFALGQNSVLLGAASFFEGIDYPDRLLERIILTRLPFDSPDQPDVKARYAQLTAAHQNPFQVDALPRATMRLRQSFGRLIRRPTDKGVFIVLDDRLINNGYGKKMQKALPNLKPMVLDIATIADYQADWLGQDKE
ncbi:helicase C-terminal domain-containing protein [Lacticaseibacillus saniviri]|uniref:3'-5' exonuclease DinG n=3 Tax=Lacticaseibacillus saniviri TaxID=931533 RepID=A0A0R2MXF6_9LACO|nr:helicase C-terminal domain-containing protein [Lacticaseibacillus saniviri]KRO18209.1 hypothetical protein IV56_GL001339 [Lacticaseibacillus saniviri JCM 17471 = DSM 24301]